VEVLAMQAVTRGQSWELEQQLSSICACLCLKLLHNNW